MKLIRFALSFAFGTLISRILGFLRDAGIAYYFGATYVSDAFFVAFRIPNSFRRLLGEGGFNAAFVPLYSEAVGKGREKEFLSKVFAFYILTNALITFLGILLSEYIVSLIAPGLRDEKTFSLAVFMARFLFVYLFLVGLNAFFMGILNVRERFFIPAFSQAVFNGVFLFVLLLISNKYGYVALIVGVLLGGLFQVLINVPFLAKERVPFAFKLSFDEDVKLLLRRLAPALGGFGVNQLSLFIDTFLASFLKTGAISYLYYANRLYQLPFGIVSVGVANSLLSILSKSPADKRFETTNGFRLILIFMIPATAGLLILAEEIIRVVYHRGSFTEEDVRYTAGALSIYSLGLLFFSFQKVLSAVFFSKGDTATPVKASFLTILSEGILASIFAFVLNLGVFGLPVGTAISSIFGLMYLMGKSKIRPDGVSLAKTTAKVVPATALMSVIVFYIKETDLSPLSVIFISLPSAVFIYFSALYILREELTLRLFQSLVKKFMNS